MALRFIYTLFIGVFLGMFIGVGIAAFYPDPKYPDQPLLLKYCSSEIVKDASKYTEFKKESEIFDKAEKAYFKKSQVYNRNVSIITIIAAIIVVITSLTLFKSILLIADGLLLGGVLTLIYSILRGFGTDDNMYRFIVVSIGFVVSLVLGYIKFIKSTASILKNP